MADEGEELPRGVRRREDGSYSTAYWRRDEVWIVGGMILAVVLLVSFLAYFTNGAPTHPSAGSTQRAAESLADSAQSSSGPLSPFWWVIAILIIGFVVAVVGYVVWALLSIYRAKGVGYDDVSAEEQARRREVARLLKQVEPAVTYDEALLSARPRGARRPRPDLAIPVSPSHDAREPVRVLVGPRPLP